MSDDRGGGRKPPALFSLVVLGITRAKLHYGMAIAWRPRPYLPRSAGQNIGNSKGKAALCSRRSFASTWEWAAGCCTMKYQAYGLAGITSSSMHTYCKGMVPDY